MRPFEIDLDLPADPPEAMPVARLGGWRLRAKAGASPLREYAVRPLDGVPVDSMQLGPCAARRPAGLDGALWLSYVVDGSALATSGRRRQSLTAGDLAIWPDERSVTLHVTGQLHLLSMALPPRRWAHLVNPDEDAPCIRICHDSPIGPMLAGCFDGLGRRLPDIDEQHGAIVVDMAQALLNRWVDGRRSSSGAPAPHPMLARVLAHADAHLGDPDLTPQSLAAAHGMSVRSLHLLFEREGLKVAQWIRDRRLERCRDTLARPEWQGRIIDLALQWGFNDPSHFSRVFRQRYGRAPRQARALAVQSSWGAS
jgi:AraC family transcriptional regulator, positive regulator of tynA and feaB